MEAAYTGLVYLMDPTLLAVIAIGVIAGTLVGILPGLNASTATALLLPFTLQLDPIPAVAFLAAIYCADNYGGSITAILINTPGAPSAAPTAFDGYPLAKQGQAARALGMSTLSSTVGGILSLVVFIGATPFFAEVATTFRPPEYFALAVFGLSMVAFISGKSVTRNLIGGMAGVLISTVGVHLTTGVERFAFGVPALQDGIGFIPVLLGLFALGELLTQAQKRQEVTEQIKLTAIKLPSWKDIMLCRRVTLIASAIGTFIGILPGTGATVAAIVGYNESKRWAHEKEKFGKGAIEGVAGPEAANNAAVGGAMVPTLALGIPGSATAAVIMAALIMHGLRPGPTLMREQPEFMYAIFWAMLIANLSFMGLGLIGAKIFSRITLIPPSFLWSFVFVTCVVGAYSVDQSVTDVWIMLVSGLVGYIAQRHGFTPAPIVIGLILGPLAEESLSQTMIMFDNDWLMFLESPIVLAFLFITVAGVTSPFIARAYGATIRSSFARRQARKAAAGE